MIDNTPENSDTSRAFGRKITKPADASSYQHDAIELWERTTEDNLDVWYVRKIQPEKPFESLSQQVRNN